MDQEADEPGEEPEGLLARLARVPDPRSRHGRRYPALDSWVTLNLVETRTLPGGVVLTRYETRR